MGLSRPSQQLQRELRDLASKSEDIAQVIWLVAKAMPDAQAVALVEAGGVLYESVDRLRNLAERVKAGQIQAVG
ncbi:TPA: hypothetical protein SL272_000877 [Pseudomonas aeruginosa]|nr:hypothetical protein [Pseudomonas aeruginosa]